MNGARGILVAYAVGMLLAGGSAVGAEGGSARRASELKQSPFRDAATIGTLASGDKVDILKKQGGWYMVKSGRSNGWVHMLSIQRRQPRKGGDVAGLAALVSGRAGTGRVVSTTGIRGLSEEELKLAKYDADELRKLEAYAVTRVDAQNFARQGRLKARSPE